MLEDCPKCHDSGLQPIYHINSSKCINAICITIDDGEHLHYKCKCGYDFIKSVKEGEDR